MWIGVDVRIAKRQPHIRTPKSQVDLQRHEQRAKELFEAIEATTHSAVAWTRSVNRREGLRQ